VAVLLQRLQLRAIYYLDFGGGRGGPGGGGGKSIRGRGEVRHVVGRQEETADVEHGRRADNDAARAVEPDLAARRVGALEGRDHIAVEADRAGRVSRNNAVEDGIVGDTLGAGEGCGVAA